MRRAAGRWASRTLGAAIVAALIVFGVVVVSADRASAAPPLDSNPTAPTEPFEVSGYTLSDPNQPTGSPTYYMGVYDTGGRLALCWSYGYDYMSPDYEYTYLDELSSYPGMSDAQVHQIATTR
jgi:hypothetical protein